MKEYSKAYEYYKTALELSRKAGAFESEIVINENMVNHYSGNYAMAIDYFQQLENMVDQYSDKLVQNLNRV